MEAIKMELVRLGLAENGFADAIAVYDEGNGIVRLSDGTGEWIGPAGVALEALKKYDELSWEDFWEVFMTDGVVNLGN